MSNNLATYLNDHLGGAQIAVEVLEAMRDHHNDPKFRQFAGALLPEVQADDSKLRSIAEKVGSGPSKAKEVGGWLLEKAARLKLGHTGSADFEMFESGNFSRSAYKASSVCGKHFRRLQNLTLACGNMILRNF